MPWQAREAPQHTAKASTPRLARLWARVANDTKHRGQSDASAIRIANAAVTEAAEAERVKGIHKAGGEHVRRGYRII